MHQFLIFKLPFLRILNKNVKTHSSEHYRYSEMNHGFAGATGDFSDPKIRQSIDDVISRLGKFFKQVLN